MRTQDFVQKRDSILSVFNQSRIELIKLNAEIDKTVEENDSLLDLKSSNQKALKFFSKIFNK